MASTEPSSEELGELPRPSSPGSSVRHRFNRAKLRRAWRVCPAKQPWGRDSGASTEPSSEELGEYELFGPPIEGDGASTEPSSEELGELSHREVGAGPHVASTEPSSEELGERGVHDFGLRW